MTDTTATLYGYYRSSTSYRLRIMLGLKSIDYRSEVVRLDRGEQHGDDFLALNPMGAVPVVVIDGRTLVQSPAIIDYLEEQYPAPPLLPADVDQRQRVREIVSLIACDIHPVNNLRVLRRLRLQHGLNDEQVGDWYRHWIDKGFAALEAMMASGGPRFCVADRLSLAEIYLVPQVYNARRFDVDMDNYPTLKAIDAHCATLAAFRDAHPDRHAGED